MTSRIIAIAVTACLATSGCSAAVAPDEIGLEYDSGPTEATKFTNCANAGTREWRGPFDEVHVYPAGQRAWEFSTNASRDSDPIVIASREGLPLTVTGVATFSLNTSCKTLREFHERIGIKYDADSDKGWDKMLTHYLREPLTRAMQAAAGQFYWKDLYGNANTKAQWQRQAGQLAVQYVQRQAGGPYFCSATYAGHGACGAFSLSLGQPQPPPSVLAGLVKAQSAAEQAAAQKNENARIKAEMEGTRALVAVLGKQGAIYWRAIEQGKIKVVGLPTGGSINVTD